MGDSLTNVKVGVFAYNRAGHELGPEGRRSTTSAIGDTPPPATGRRVGRHRARRRSPSPWARRRASAPFTPGVAKDYTASTTANVVSTAGDATL